MLEVDTIDKQNIIYGDSKFPHKRVIWDQKVQIFAYMDVDLRMDDDSNTLDNKIEYTATVRKFNNYTKNISRGGSRGRMTPTKKGFYKSTRSSDYSITDTGLPT